MCKRVLLLMVVVANLLTMVTGCAGSFSASDLVEENLKLQYLNEYSTNYLKQVNLTTEEADQFYEQGIEVEVDVFASYFNIDLERCDSTIKPQIIEIYRKIYPFSKFEVTNSKKNGDAYDVSVTVYPIDIMKTVADQDAAAFMEEWTARGEAGDFYTLSEEEFETQWAQGIIDMVYKHVDEIGYLDAKDLQVRVEKDDNGVFSMNQDDYNTIDEWIVAY